MGHTEKTNEMYYDYSTADRNKKIKMLDSLGGKIYNKDHTETA